MKKNLDCFDLRNIISVSYAESFFFRYKQRGFCNTDLWNLVKLSASIEVLEHLPYFETSPQRHISNQTLMEKFNGMQSMTEF